jgi:hypothetical protein
MEIGRELKAHPLPLRFCLHLISVRLAGAMTSWWNESAQQVADGE